MEDPLWAQFFTGAPTRQRAVSQAIQICQESLRALANRHGINTKTVAKWPKQNGTADVRPSPKDADSTVLSIEEEAIIVAFRKHTPLPLDGCLYALQCRHSSIVYKTHASCAERIFAMALDIPDPIANKAPKRVTIIATSLIRAG